jgi:hypothetical protein
LNDKGDLGTENCVGSTSRYFLNAPFGVGVLPFHIPNYGSIPWYTLGSGMDINESIVQFGIYFLWNNPEDSLLGTRPHDHRYGYYIETGGTTSPYEINGLSGDDRTICSWVDLGSQFDDEDAQYNWLLAKNYRVAFSGTWTSITSFGETTVNDLSFAAGKWGTANTLDIVDNGSVLSPSSVGIGFQWTVGEGQPSNQTLQTSTTYRMNVTVTLTDDDNSENTATGNTSMSFITESAGFGGGGGGDPFVP